MSVDIKLHPIKRKKDFKPTDLIKLPLFFGIRDKYDILRPGEIAKIDEELVVYNVLEPGRGVILVDDGEDYYIRLNIPATTSDLEVLIILMEAITTEFKIPKIYCDEKIYAAEAIDRIKDYVLENMQIGLKFLSGPAAVKDVEIFGALIPIAIDETEQKYFKNSQTKFDVYMSKKQRLAQTAEMIPAVIVKTDYGNIWAVFVAPHPKPLILPRFVATRRKNVKVDHFIAVTDYGSLEYKDFLDKVDTSERFDATRFIKVFTEEELRGLFEGGPNYLKEIQGDNNEIVRMPDNRPDKNLLKEERKLKEPERKTGESLKDYYSRIGLDNKKIKLVKRYFLAFVNLYGIIPLRKAFEIIMEQNPGDFTVESLLAFIHNCKYNRLDYRICSPDEFYEDAKDLTPLDDELLHISFLEMEDYDDYYETVESQHDKPYYIPEKDELLKYADDFYVCRGKQLDDLVDFLEENAKTFNPQMSMREVAEEYMFSIHIQARPEPEIDSLLHYLLPPSSRKEATDFLEKLLPYIIKLTSNTRLLVNRGYTPAEMAEINGGISNDIRMHNPEISW